MDTHWHILNSSAVQGILPWGDFVLPCRIREDSDWGGLCLPFGSRSVAVDRCWNDTHYGCGSYSNRKLQWHGHQMFNVDQWWHPARVRTAIPTPVIPTPIIPTCVWIGILRSHAVFQSVNPGVVRDQSCPWVGLAHGLDWAASDWVEIFQTSVVGCVGLGRH